jgi:hypothetical protein
MKMSDVKNELLQAMLEKAKTDKNGLVKLKNAAVRLQQFELAALLRGIETDLFPVPKEDADSKKHGEEISCALRMCRMNAEPKTCYIISQTVKIYGKKKGKFSLRDAAKIETDAARIFDHEV